MARRKTNTQMFALPALPPDELAMGAARYRLTMVFKHDFYAATCLYEASLDAPGASATMPKIVVKFYRTQPFCGFPMAWLGRFSRDHERAIYQLLAGVPGLPRWAGAIGPAGFAIEYIEGAPVDQVSPLPAGFFDRLREIFDAVHARGVAYVDANKRSNILVGPGERAFLIDFQIALRRRDDWPWPLRALLARWVRALQEKDLYHLYKHKRRLAPEELTGEEEKLSRLRGFWHWAHSRLIKPYKAVRRGFLARQHRAGRLASPTAELETHPQPEKDTWRED